MTALGDIDQSFSKSTIATWTAVQIGWLYSGESILLPWVLWISVRRSKLHPNDDRHAELLAILSENTG